MMSRLEPYEPRMVPGFLDSHIFALASNFCSVASEIEDVSTDAHVAFKFRLPRYRVRSEFRVGLVGGEVFIGEPNSNGGFSSDTSDFEAVFGAAGLQTIWPSPPSAAILPPPLDVVLAAFSRLDRRVLLLLRGAGTLSASIFALAAQLPDESPLFELAGDYPALGDQFATLADCSYTPAGVISNQQLAKEARVYSADPVAAFAAWVDERQKELWPAIAASPETVRVATEHYLSIPSNGQYGMDANAAAFMCHLPGYIHPRTTGEMGALVEFVDRHIHMLEPDGMGILPTTFPREFQKRLNGEWQRLHDFKQIAWEAYHQDLAATVLGVAAFEARYDAWPVNFEDNDPSEVRFELGVRLFKEVTLGLFEAFDAVSRVKRGGPSPDRWAANTDCEIRAYAIREFRKFAKVGLINRRHLGRSALEVLTDMGYDIHAIVAQLVAPMPTLSDTGDQDLPQRSMAR